jgi:hypothetical protein
LHETKPITEYRRDSRGYWRSCCNPCQAAANAEWKARNRAAYLDGKGGFAMWDLMAAASPRHSYGHGCDEALRASSVADTFVTSALDEAG